MRTHDHPELEFPAFYCDTCGEVSANDYLHDLNHTEVPDTGLCITAWLRRQHQSVKETQ